MLQSIIVITNILRYTHAHKQLHNRYSNLSRWYAYINWQIQLYSSTFYAPCSLANKPYAVQCALLGVSSVCWENWTDTLICRNLATQLSGRLLIIPNQITQKPEIKTSSQQRWGQPRTEWELNAPMGLIRNHGRGNRVGKMFALHRSWTERGLKSHVRMFKYLLM